MKTYSMKIHRQIKAVPVFQTLNFFYLFAVLGWLWEFCLRYHMTGKIAKWGVLHGTWAPIYGAGAVLTILLAKLLARYPVRLFVGSMMICTLVEYITSCLLEMAYGRKWWDYSNRFLFQIIIVYLGLKFVVTEQTFFKRNYILIIVSFM